MKERSGLTYWLFGPRCKAMPKYTERLKDLLAQAGHRVRLLNDGDLRQGLCADLGFSEWEQLEATRRAAHLARSHLHVGDMVVVGTTFAVVHSHHPLLRNILGEDLRLVHVECEHPACSIHSSAGTLAALPRSSARPDWVEMDSVIHVPEKSMEEAFPQLVAMAEDKGKVRPQPAVVAQPEPEPELPLSAREAEILRLVSQGQRNKEIATILGISPTTVRTHLERAYRKLAVNSRAGAVALFVRRARPQAPPVCPAKE